MPCNCDHLEATDYEIELSKMYWVQDDLNGYKHRGTYGDGFDERAYNQHKKLTKEFMDKMAAKLCKRLSKRERVDDLTLETQIWWRDHQEADRKREQRELANRYLG